MVQEIDDMRAFHHSMYYISQIYLFETMLPGTVRLDFNEVWEISHTSMYMIVYWLV